MTTDITRTDYPTDPSEGTPVETPPNTWLPTVIDVYPWLGYAYSYKNWHSGHGSTRIELSDTRLVSVHRLVAWLQYWDTQLRDMSTTGMANQVGSLSLDFTKGAALVKQEASRTLQELASLIDVPLLKDKYYPKKTGSSLMVKSLF